MIHGRIPVSSLLLLHVGKDCKSKIPLESTPYSTSRFLSPKYMTHPGAGFQEMIPVRAPSIPERDHRITLPFPATTDLRTGTIKSTVLPSGSPYSTHLCDGVTSPRGRLPKEGRSVTVWRGPVVIHIHTRVVKKVPSSMTLDRGAGRSAEPRRVESGAHITVRRVPRKGNPNKREK